MPKTRIFVAGHKGMVGSSLIKFLQKDKNIKLILKDRKKLDLINQSSVLNFFRNEKIDQVYIAAAKVGGINANNIFPADFIYENLMITSNIVHSAFLSGVKKLLFLGSSCIYPKYAKQPMREEYLLSGKLEPTNEPYAIAKIAGIKMCESYNRQYSESFGIDYRSIMPTNLYGPGDNFNEETGHVIPALISKFHNAKIKKKFSVTVWGTGKAKREFMHVDDMARACIHIMNLEKSIFDKYTKKLGYYINAGTGKDVTIKKLVETIKQVVGYTGRIKFDKTKPDGSPRKLMSSTRLVSLKWKPKIKLKEGLTLVYNSFLKS
jgi:GDP-L-fucose synthase